MKRVLIGPAIVIAFSWVMVLADSSTGAIQGRVVDGNAKPVSAAKVIVTPVGGDEDSQKSATTDAKGKFVVANLPLGPYTVGAEKQDVAYPNTALAFYNGAGAEPITLTTDKPTATVNLTFKVRAAVLSGVVTDSVSNDPVRATFLLRRANHPEILLAGEFPSNYRILVPSDTDIRMEVAAPGYKTWYYPGTIDPKETQPLHIKGASKLQRDIQLDRTNPDS